MVKLICHSWSIIGCGPVQCLHAELSEFSSMAFAISVYLLKHIIEMLQQGYNIMCSFVDLVAVYVVQAMLLLDQITEGVKGHYLMVLLLRAPRHPGALQTENVH